MTAPPYPPPGYALIGGYLRPTWTPRGFVDRGDAVMLTCEDERCGRRAAAPLQQLVDLGEGDKILAEFRGRWRCAGCGGRRVRVEVVERERATS